MIPKTPEELLEIYKDALSFYATSENYPNEYDTAPSIIERDGGDRARSVLLTFMEKATLKTAFDALQPTNSEPEYKRRAKEDPR